ncbi:hypothetical protein [Nostoc sp. TCL240-02]|nr:hypothetical protein [Nostoc sp. TCL240-02]
MINTTKESTIKNIQADASSLGVKLDINLQSLPTHEVERLAQAFKDAKK